MGIMQRHADAMEQSRPFPLPPLIFILPGWFGYPVITLKSQSIISVLSQKINNNKNRRFDVSNIIIKIARTLRWRPIDIQASTILTLDEHV